MSFCNRYSDVDELETEAPQTLQPFEQYDPLRIQYKAVYSNKFTHCLGVTYALDAIEFTCVIFFTVEFFIRVIACPDKREFFRQYLTICDILAIAPFYARRVFRAAGIESLVIVEVGDCFRIFRIFRVFKVCQPLRESELLIELNTIVFSIKLQYYCNIM